MQTNDRFEKNRFPRPAKANDEVAFPGNKGSVDAFENFFSTEGFSDALDTNHQNRISVRM